MLHHLPILQVQLYKIIVSFPALIPKTVIIIGISTQINVEPSKIRRPLSIPYHILKLIKASSHMIEHTVQHHTDSVCVELIHHFLKILIASQPGVDLFVISGIISMSVRLKYR